MVFREPEDVSFFFNDPSTTEIYTRPYTLSLHDALPIFLHDALVRDLLLRPHVHLIAERSEEHTSELQSHGLISYAVFCLKKKNAQRRPRPADRAPRTANQRTRIGDRTCNSIVRYACQIGRNRSGYFFFFNDTATTEIYTRPYTLSLHDALPISTPPTLMVPTLSAQVAAAGF